MKKDRVTLVAPGDKPVRTPIRVLVAGDDEQHKKFRNTLDAKITALSVKAIEIVDFVRTHQELIEKLGAYEYDCIVVGRRIDDQNSVYLLESLTNKYELCPPFILLDDKLETREIVKAFRVGFGDCVVSNEGRSGELVSAIKRVTEKYRKAQQLHDEIEFLSKLATHDRLTGMSNRAYLDERLEQLDESAIRHQSPFAVLLIDVNGFRQINDTYGHPVGDQAIQAFGRRLAQHARKSDTFGRYDGDDFLYLVDRGVSRDTIELLGARLADALSMDVRIEDVSLSLSASVGIAYFPVHGGNSKQLLFAARQALDYAKSKGGGYAMSPAGAAGEDAAVSGEPPILPSSPPANQVDAHADEPGGVGNDPSGVSQASAKGAAANVSDRAAAKGDQRRERAAPGFDPEENRRGARRFRVLKRGQIIIANGMSTIDCVVRDLSEHGARISVEDPIILPENFSFMLVEEGTIYPAFKRWQHGKSIGIEFSDSTQPSPVKPFLSGRSAI